MINAVRFPAKNAIFIALVPISLIPYPRSTEASSHTSLALLQRSLNPNIHCSKVPLEQCIDTCSRGLSGGRPFRAEDIPAPCRSPSRPPVKPWRSAHILKRQGASYRPTYRCCQRIRLGCRLLLHYVWLRL